MNLNVAVKLLDVEASILIIGKLILKIRLGSPFDCGACTCLFAKRKQYVDHFCFYSNILAVWLIDEYFHLL